MYQKPHIVYKVAEENRRLHFDRLTTPGAYVRPRILGDEIGVEFQTGEFIPYADLGYSFDIGFFRISETHDVANDALPYAASGQLIECGQVILTQGIAPFLSNEMISGLVQRHMTGDFGEFGDFYDLEVTDDMLLEGAVLPCYGGSMNKISTLTGMEAVTSEYIVDRYRVRIITEAGENRSTVILLAGLIPG
jgi:hypothetical protein